MKTFQPFFRTLIAVAAGLMVVAVISGPAQDLKPNEIGISGAITKTFTPTSSEARAVDGKIVISLREKTVSGVILTLPPNTKFGTYAIGDRKSKPAPDFLGEYDVFGPDQASYSSTAGSLVLTFTGSAYSGYVRFQAVNTKDAAKSIWVIGSFTDVPFKTK